jgi:hypothetical protein
MLDVREKENGDAGSERLNVEVELTDESGSKDPELELEARERDENCTVPIQTGVIEWSISAERRCGCGSGAYSGERGEEGRARMRTGGGERGWSRAKEREGEREQRETCRTVRCPAPLKRDRGGGMSDRRHRPGASI